MAHRNARLTPLTRLELVRAVDAGWTQTEVARRFRVTPHTVAKWLRRFREEGLAGLDDRSSAPHSHPRRTSPELERRICAVRRTQGFGPHRIQWTLGIARSTVYAVLLRHGLNRLDRLHRVTREQVRYEHPAPGDLLHLDVKKLGRIPEGGGKRMAPGFAETRSGPHSRRSLGVEYLHVASTTTAATPTSRPCPTSEARRLPPALPLPLRGRRGQLARPRLPPPAPGRAAAAPRSYSWALATETTARAALYLPDAHPALAAHAEQWGARRSTSRATARSTACCSMICSPASTR